MFLFALLVLTVGFTLGVLFLKFKLESLRQGVEAEAERRTGLHLAMDAVHVNGLRGIRIDGLNVGLSGENQPELSIQCPVAYINLDYVDLLRGAISIERIQLDDALITITRPPGGRWVGMEKYLGDSISEIKSPPPFRLTGSGCRLSVNNIVAGTNTLVEDFRFDAYRLADANTTVVNLMGRLDSEGNKRVKVDASFVALDDFDVRVQCDALTREEINIFFPASDTLLEAGTADPSIRIIGFPNQRFALYLDVPFQDLALRERPPFLAPATGAISLLAQYSGTDETLRLTTGKLESDQLNGDVEGLIAFYEERPKFDVSLRMRDIPTSAIIDYFGDRLLPEGGEVGITLDPKAKVTFRLTGNPEAPVIALDAVVPSGDLKYIPIDPRLPRIQLTLGDTALAWSSDVRQPGGSVTLLDGTVSSPIANIEATQLRGTVRLSEGRVTVEPLTMNILESPFLTKGEYFMETGDVRLEVTGTFPKLEVTPLAEIIKNTYLEGPATIRGQLEKKGGNVSATTHIEASQALIRYAWWFVKPPGIGAQGDVKFEFVPKKHFNITIDGEVASSPLHAELDFRHNFFGQNLWRQVRTDAQISSLDINGVGKCLKVPYRVTGGKGREGTFHLERKADDQDKTYLQMGLSVDELALLPNEATVPFQFKETQISVSMESYKEKDDLTGTLSLNAKDATTPAFGETWFLPMAPPPELAEQFPPRHRDWTYNLAVDTLTLPPWNGTSFTGQGHSLRDTSGLDTFQASVGEGLLKGSYRSIPAENSYTLEADWEGIPVHYLLSHLKFPSVFEGPTWGKIAYSIDRDDPATLEGSGAFEVRDGRIRAEAFYENMHERFEEDLAAIPSNLSFRSISSSIQLKGDTIVTPDFKLDSDGLKVAATGQYVSEGDMDYTLQLAIAPKLAETIPTLQDSLLVEGHRIGGDDIELTFKMSGPVFNPKGQLASVPPASVTLKSGALELTSEAIKVIDLPRKIILDLFKIGGGIVGAAQNPRTPPENRRDKP